MKKSLRIAISPCPNDTFIWGPLALGEIRTPLRVSFDYEDIQTLNAWAQQGRADIIKLSFYQFAQLPRGLYRLLPTGAALGENVGPLLIGRRVLSQAELAEASIGLPGFSTTAYALFRFYAPHAQQLIAMRYDHLIPAVAAGEIDAAVIIHESRFTYEAYGLKLIQDLGAYWQAQTGHLVPLGGVAIRKGVWRRPVIRALRRSLRSAQRHRSARLMAFIGQYAREISPAIQMAHIDLYVNRYTYRLGPKGQAAIRYFLRWVRSRP
ncbi:MAG: 1,4-dihydroxy-6-naphthoate synthase [Bacteroidia bacterium]|nr:1,4-dihydroxy-6-naphthoate synthase [Bacteroidia bacterium]MDW8088347.1 1,4-dihydroxy-6-naphthoate synthase [Bacteroidia bacterium]